MKSGMSFRPLEAISTLHFYFTNNKNNDIIIQRAACSMRMLLKNSVLFVRRVLAKCKITTRWIWEKFLYISGKNYI